MRTTLLFSLLCFATMSMAQTNRIGVKAGAGIGMARGGAFRGERGAMPVFSGGLSFDRSLGARFYAGTDLLYQQRGFSSDMNITDMNGEEIRIRRSLRYRYNYLAMPLRAGVRYGKRISGFTGVAVVPGVLLQAQSLSKTTAFPNGDIAGTTKLDLSAQLETGLGYKLSRRYALSATACYQHSFGKVATPWIAQAGKAAPMLISGLIGVHYTL